MVSKASFRLNFLPWLVVLLIVSLEVIYIQGFAIGLQSLAFWLVVGYFLADIQIALIHFEIDNFKPDDNGYKHHLIVAKYGFKYEMLSSGQHHHNDKDHRIYSDHFERNDDSITDHSGTRVEDTVMDTNLCSPGRPNICGPCRPVAKWLNVSTERDLCSPGSPGVCSPCGPSVKRPDVLLEKAICSPRPPSVCNPCGPVSKKLVYRSSILLSTPSSIVTCLAPIICFYVGLPVGMGLTIPIVSILNSISGTGAPDFYAHHPEQAPAYIKFAQQFRLLMTPAAHEKHHKNPRGGYAYFSPITNVLLDNTGFWWIAKMAMEWKKNAKAMPVPIPSLD